MANPKPRYSPQYIAPQAHEIEAMLAVLEADYKDAKAAARKAAATGLSFVAARSWWTIASTLDGKYPNFIGLFTTESAARKALETNSLGLFGVASVHEITGIDERSDVIQRWEDEARLRYCVACGHIDVAHNWPARKGRAAIDGCVACTGEVRCTDYMPPPDSIPKPSTI